MAPKEFPWQNRLLKNLKGERWSGVPGLEEYFMISDFGRVKRLEYESEFEDGRVFRMKPMIMKPHLAKAPNHYMNDHTFFLRVTLTVTKKVYHFSIARLVYHCFKKAFDLQDKNLFIVSRDGNGRNVRPSNLLQVTHQGRRMRVIKGGRNENILLRKEVRVKGVIANREKNGKQISRYDRNGKRLMTYPNIPAAAAAVGISKEGISGVLRGRKVTAAKYYWRYGAENKIDIERFLQKRRASNKSFSGKKVIQYDAAGHEVGSYISINEAARKSGACSTAIGKVANGKAKTAGGFIWKSIRKNKNKSSYI